MPGRKAFVLLVVTVVATLSLTVFNVVKTSFCTPSESPVPSGHVAKSFLELALEPRVRHNTTDVSAGFSCEDRSRQNTYRLGFSSFLRKRTVGRGFNYVGCFRDARPERDFEHFVGSISPLSVGYCVDECSKRDKRFAGVQNRWECWCSNVIGRYGHVPDDECQSACYNNPGEICGGKLRNSVFSVNASDAVAWLERLPPPAPLPISPGSLTAYLQRQHVPYAKLCECGCESSLSRTPRDLNVYLPVHGRPAALKTTLFYLKHAVLQAAGLLNASIVVVQVGPVADLRVVCETAGVEYLFVPQGVAELTGCDNSSFPKSLAFNLAFLMAQPARWNLFHDVDVLVPAGFLRMLALHYLPRPDLLWLQPYAGRSLRRFDSNVTADVQQAAWVGPPLDLSLLPSTLRENDKGSPGGSILVRRDLFEMVGGYDPELFWNYAPEDAFFWSKLKWFSLPQYADDPPIEMHHMAHAPTNPDPGQPGSLALEYMLHIQENYDLFSALDKLSILRLKQSLLS